MSFWVHWVHLCQNWHNGTYVPRFQLPYALVSSSMHQGPWTFCLLFFLFFYGMSSCRLLAIVTIDWSEWENVPLGCNVIPPETRLTRTHFSVTRESWGFWMINDWAQSKVSAPAWFLTRVCAQSKETRHIVCLKYRGRIIMSLIAWKKI